MDFRALCGANLVKNGSNVSTFDVFSGRESTLRFDLLDHVLLAVEHDRPANESHELMAPIS